MSAWKIHERIANASEIRMPTELGNHIEDANTTNITGPAMSAPKKPAVAVSGFSLSIMAPAFHEPSTSTQAPTVTATK